MIIKNILNFEQRNNIKKDFDFNISNTKNYKSKSMV